MGDFQMIFAKCGEEPNKLLILQQFFSYSFFKTVFLRQMSVQSTICLLHVVGRDVFHMIRTSVKFSQGWSKNISTQIFEDVYSSVTFRF